MPVGICLTSALCSAGKLAADIQRRVETRLRDLRMFIIDHDALASEGKTGTVHIAYPLYCRAVLLSLESERSMHCSNGTVMLLLK